MGTINKKIVAGINGFGRFGLHLLKYWLDRNKEANFIIQYINDDTLSLQDAYQIITNDKYVQFNKYKIQAKDDTLIILEPNGARHVINYTNKNQFEIPWLGKPDMVLECSGKNFVAKDCKFYIADNVKLVVISATSWDADKTLVYGFNHKDFDGTEEVISYGSCTVNAYVPFAAFLHKKYTILESDVNVIHNIQEYRLKGNQTLNRKFCTLERSGPKLLGFIGPQNFIVNYTVIPHTGVSMIDFRFRVREKITKELLIADLGEAFVHGALKHLYDFDETDIGPDVYNCTTYSNVFIKDQVKVLGENIYLQGYLDTENSANRYYDLINYICEQEAFVRQARSGIEKSMMNQFEDIRRSS